MNVATITMEPDAAREKLRALRRQLHRRADAEYEALASGYEALIEGRPVLSLEGAIHGGGFDEQDRPRLAVGRADRRQVHFRWNTNTPQATFSTQQNSTRLIDSMVRSVDMGRNTTHTRAPYRWEIRDHGHRPTDRFLTLTRGYALMPIVPAEVVSLIGGGSNLRLFFTLFEVEAWASEPILAKPDIDPYLLRHLGGDLYAVVAEWELTDLERLVMVGRRDG